MSFTQGLSGLSAADQDLSVISNNVANANTVGFKESEAQFADVFAAALSSENASQVGIGTKVATVAQEFVQGGISTSSNNLDMAINGPGFFVLKSSEGVTGYSRNGQFQLNNNGYIVSSTGEELQGYLPDPVTGKMVGSPQALSIPTGIANASQTTKVTAGLNLDSTSQPPTNSPFNPDDPTTYDNMTSTTTYDSLGDAQVTSMYFVKTAANTWDVYSNVTDPTTGGNLIPPDSAAAGGNTGTGAITAPTLASTNVDSQDQVTVTFTSPTQYTVTDNTTSTTLAGSPFTYNPINGATLSVNGWTAQLSGAPNAGDSFDITPPPVTPTGTLTFTTNGTYAGFTTTNPLVFQPPGASVETVAFDFAGASQFGASFGVTSLTQDGYTSGQLSGFTIGTDGSIQGNYSNGITKILGQVALATFPDMQGLQPLGNNEWAQTSASGAPTTNAPGIGNNGVLQTSAVEDSNVDLTTQLVDMITAQRDYQANAQSIKTEDAMMQTIVNLQ